MKQRRTGTAEGLAQLEGYVLLHAEREAAREAAQAFTDRMPWLTHGQRQEVARLYTEDRVILLRHTLEHIAHRCHELRGEYGDRYARLRRRVLCVAVALLLAATALCSAVLGIVTIS